MAAPVRPRLLRGPPWRPVVVDSDESLGFRPVDGELDSKARVVALARRLERVELERRDGASTWLRQGDALVDAADGFRDAMARHGLPDVLSLLTTEQYRLITASRTRPVVLQGRASCGKTTVALHRVSWLTHPDAAADDVVPVDPSRVLMVMFNRALSAFVETSLAPLGQHTKGDQQGVMPAEKAEVGRDWSPSHDRAV